MNDFKFDENEHKYFVNGVETPSVTDICNPISFERFKEIPNHILEQARQRGTEVHEMCEEYLITGEIDWEEISPQYTNYINQFVTWYRTYKPKILYVEFQMFSEEFCGTCDLICELDGKTLLVDFKSSSRVDKKSLSVQLAGYHKLCAKYNIEIDETWYLHLTNKDKNDGYVFKQIDRDEEWFEILLKHNKKMKEK